MCGCLRGCVSIQLLWPLVRSAVCGDDPTVEAPFICDVVHEQDAHGASVICRRDGAEALLAGGIPYL